jgi:hypothetical protein
MATIKPIICYGIATQNIGTNNIRRIQSTLSKMIRKIDEKERWTEAFINDKIKDFKRGANNHIRKKWSIANIDGLLNRERTKFLLRAKKTAATAYLTNPAQTNAEIANLKNELENIKNSTNNYNGRFLTENH